MNLDGRTLDHATLGRIRLTEMRPVPEGEEPAAAIASFRFCHAEIYKWMKLKGGAIAGRAR